MMNRNEGWQKTDAQIFWGEVAPGDHVVQVYEDDDALITLLEDFVIGGIRNGDSVVIIATGAHIRVINDKLRHAGFDPFQLKLKDQFIPLDANQVLDSFLVNDQPDELLFRHIFADVLSRAQRYNRHVRAFGEMVVLLMERGLPEQTIALENLWNAAIRNNSGISLFCAYPISCFKEYENASIEKICCTHSHIIAEAGNESNDVLFKNVQRVPVRNL